GIICGRLGGWAPEATRTWLNSPRWAGVARPRWTRSVFYQERRKEIIGAAAHVFRERGFEATNFGLIAAKLGADRATLYYYFNSKQTLFREVVQEVALKTIADAEFIAAKEATAEAKLREAFEGLLQTYSSSYPYMHVFLQESLPVIPTSTDAWDNESHNWGRRYYLAIRRIIQQGVD